MTEETENDRHDGTVHDHDVQRIIPQDAIPSVDDPQYEETYPGDPDDTMIVVESNSIGFGTVFDSKPSSESGPDSGSKSEFVARAYPVRYLRFHEIVNDELGGVPIAVTWCPLCAAAVVYDRRLDSESFDGPWTLTFGVSGKLADDDLVMYDRETETEWKQSSGRAIAGALADESLTTVPASMTTWERFAGMHPEGDVLAAPGGKSEAASSGDEPAPIDYDENPYRAYVEGDGFGLGAHRDTGSRKWDRPDLDPKTPVLGVEVDDDALAFSLPAVVETGDGAGSDPPTGVETETVGGRDVVVFAVDDELHAFAHPGYEWRSVPGGFRATRPDGSGALYDGRTGEPVDAPAAHTGEAGGATAEPLRRLPAKRLFAFAWRDDHGDAFYVS